MSNVTLYEQLCKGVDECGICVSVCRKGVFRPGKALNRKGYRPPVIADAASCTGCGDCMIFCPDMAIAVAQKTKKERKGIQGR
jgi:2-oxoglutarate ferredoxin oxidoreductase subunit delta